MLLIQPFLLYLCFGLEANIIGKGELMQKLFLAMPNLGWRDFFEPRFSCINNSVC